jgi:hypothetical protein
MDEHGCPTGAGGGAGCVDMGGDVGVDVEADVEVDVGLFGLVVVALDFGTVLDAGVTGGAAADWIFGGDKVVSGEELVDGEGTVSAAEMVGREAKAAATVEPSLSALYHGPPVNQIAKTNKKAAVTPTAVGILQDNDPSRC